MKEARFDVVVIGGGPAGAAAALALARGGARTALIDHLRPGRRRSGETAPPETRRLLAAVGAADLLDDPRIAVAAPAIASVWDGAAAERNHIASPYGLAAHLDRATFDEALLGLAGEAGAVIIRRRARRGAPDAGEEAVVELDDGGRVQAGFALVATGRGGTGAGFPLRRRRFGRQVAIIARFGGVATDRRALVEAIVGGWLYAAPFPGAGAVVAFVTSAGAVPATRGGRLRLLDEALAESRLVGPAVADLPPPIETWTVPAGLSAAKVVGGARWCAIGDARFAGDPLSGSGVAAALGDALFAADSILARNPARLADEMRARSRVDLAAHDRESVRFYGGATFCNLPFWREAARPALEGVSYGKLT